MIAETITIRWLGQQDYLSCWQAMQQFTSHRDDQTIDEIWLLEHHPVFTQGQSGKIEHILDAGHIPIVQTDRGGQVTYHGPGQLMIYLLIDLKRKQLHVREFVTCLEKSVIDLLAAYHITAHAKREAPGVYIKGDSHLIAKKVCSIGLRIRRGCTYHGLAFNVAMDLTPFNRINPCGFADLKMTQFSELGGLADTQKTGHELIHFLSKNLRYTTAHYIPDNHSD